MSDAPAAVRRKPGRPRKIVDRGKVVQCAMVGMSAREVAAEIGISITSLERLKRDPTLKEAIRLGKTGTKYEILASLRDEAIGRRTVSAIRELMRRLELAEG
jgi:hypothetical protein